MLSSGEIAASLWDLETYGQVSMQYMRASERNILAYSMFSRRFDVIEMKPSMATRPEAKEPAEMHSDLMCFSSSEDIRVRLDASTISVRTM